MKKATRHLPSLRAPLFTMVASNDNVAAFSYWQGGSYTSYSENGRYSSSYSYDVLGQIRESRASYKLKKNGALSYWHIQFSPQRTRPLFVYTIH
jgi:hypothetical protein